MMSEKVMSEKVKRAKDWPPPPPSKRDESSTSAEADKRRSPLFDQSALLPPECHERCDVKVTMVLDEGIANAIDKLRETIEEAHEVLERLNNERKLEALTGKIDL